MGHRYVKEEDTFSTSANGTVPKPTAGDVTNNNVLRADGSWVQQSGGGGSSHTYSTTEQVVGTWINGKPIYEKTYQLTAPSTASSTNIIDTAALNIDLMIKLEGIIKVASNTTLTGGNSFILWERHSTSDGNKIAAQVSNSSYWGGAMYVILQYTKTTD